MIWNVLIAFMFRRNLRPRMGRGAAKTRPYVEISVSPTEKCSSTRHECCYCFWAAKKFLPVLHMPFILAALYSAVFRRASRWTIVALQVAIFILPVSLEAAAITPGTRYPTNEEQYTLQLINRARTSADGLTILQSLVTNNLSTITASSTGTSGTGTKWSTGFWKSGIPTVATSMNAYKVHPGDLKRQFMDLGIPGTPFAWNEYLGNVASGYNAIVIASKGTGAGFPHALSPYADQSSFTAYAKRYTDGGYGPLNQINALAENIAPNFPTDPLSIFAGFMIDWGATANGIQSQDPDWGSHRISLMGSDYVEIGISRIKGWGATNVTETQEFGRRFNAIPTIVGAVYKDTDANAFYTPGEGQGQVTVTAAPVGGGASYETTTYSSGGYALPIPNPGAYTVTFSTAAGILKTASVTVGNENVALDAIVTTVIAPNPPNPPDPTEPTDPQDPPVPPQPSKLNTDFNGDNHPDFVLYFATGRRTQIWHLDNAAKLSQADGPALALGWTVAGVADFNGDGHPDYLIYHASTRKTQVLYLNGATQIGTAMGPVLTSGWTIAGVGDFNGDGKTDLLIYKSSTRDTAVWHLDGVTPIPAGLLAGPKLPASFLVEGVADFNLDGKPDLLLYNKTSRKTIVYYLDGPAKTGEAAGPTLPSGWAVNGVADFDGDGRPDLVNYATVGRKTQIMYLGGVTSTGTATGPVLTSGSVLAAP